MQERLLQTLITLLAVVTPIFVPYWVGRMVLYFGKKDHALEPRFTCWALGFACSVVGVIAFCLVYDWVHWVIYGN